MSTWIATFLFMRDVDHLHEWETLHITSISTKKIITIITGIGIGISILQLFGKEFITYPLAQRAKTYKMKHFKQNSGQKIFNAWFSLNNNLFAHISYLDLATKKGEWLTLLELDKKFRIKKQTSCPHFSIDIPKNTVHTKNAIMVSSTTQKQNNIKNISIRQPDLFALFKLHAYTPNIIEYALQLLRNRKLLNKLTFARELSNILRRLCNFLQPTLFLLLTVCLFFLFHHHSIIRWLSILLVYPIFIALLSLVIFLVDHGFNAISIILPYGILLLTILLIKKHL